MQRLRLAVRSGQRLVTLRGVIAQRRNAEWQNGRNNGGERRNGERQRRRTGHGGRGRRLLLMRRQWQ